MSLLDTVLAMAQTGVEGEKNSGLAGSQAFKDMLTNAGTDGSPDLGGLVGHLFDHSDDAQKQGLINHVATLLGPQGSAIVGQALGVQLPEGADQYTAEHTSGISSEQVRALISQAHQFSPELADQLGGFYSEHESLLNTVGGFMMAFIQKSKQNPVV